MPIGEVGEIWIRSPQVMKGYWNMPEETAKAITADGWFQTGDAGYLDADGYLYIHDRVKDMIVSGGENVYPAEVENVLMAPSRHRRRRRHRRARREVGRDRQGDRRARRPASDVTEAEIIAYARERLARFKCPTSVDWVEMLPRNPSGKVLKKDLRAPFWEGHDRRVG